MVVGPGSGYSDIDGPHRRPKDTYVYIYILQETISVCKRLNELSSCLMTRIKVRFPFPNEAM